jgi:hypothetical protein
MRGSRLDHLEELAEELIKENPEETVVRAHMKAAGLRYTGDTNDRLTFVLNSLDQARTYSPDDGASNRKNGMQNGKDL